MPLRKEQKMSESMKGPTWRQETFYHREICSQST